MDTSKLLDMSSREWHESAIANAESLLERAERSLQSRIDVRVDQYERRSRSPEAIAAVVEMVHRDHERRQAVLRACIGKHARALSKLSSN